jgi:hypothetical protein
MAQATKSAAGTCNQTISASGTYVVALTSAGHTSFNVATWDGQRLGSIENSAMAGWLGEEIGAGMDRTRFSVNSDKWVSVWVGWPGDFGRLGGRFGKNGNNAYLVNWVDKVAIRLTDNPRPKNETDTIWSSEPASFRIVGVGDGVESTDGASGMRSRNRMVQISEELPGAEIRRYSLGGRRIGVEQTNACRPVVEVMQGTPGHGVGARVRVALRRTGRRKATAHPPAARFEANQ